MLTIISILKKKEAKTQTIKQLSQGCIATLNPCISITKLVTFPTEYHLPKVF